MIALEAFCNAAIGLVVSWTLTLTVLGYSPTQAVWVTLLFFTASFVRSYLLRRFFAWMNAR
mgnify:FL=1